MKFEVSGRIARPIDEVFEAVVNPEKLSGYFTTGGARGRLETGATVTWDFADFPGAFPVYVAEVEKNKRIILHWDASDTAAERGGEAGHYQTQVTMRFEALEDGRTLVSIAEEGWRQTPEGLKSTLSNKGGWMQMLCCLKAFLEHGINLREGMFR
ncbi:hypothetical protein HHI_00830 [Hyphomonas hirschiana VP5]|uniref:Activator of Hsp90 ATPase homologue 1/2-like C-terminal domain-containing protein n=1 Tax=Hyphomonas hirschiana VP5 TaxID=1280951 RepID=A0A059G0J8_9PROT|nr:hypothetical protein HHI_00830 [Hyphomonas hirschiana VP5]